MPDQSEYIVQITRLADQIAQAADQPTAMKRFTIDVPLELHTRIKIECARRGIAMADMVREMLEQRFHE
jgi:predicted HicB family RNase H-like nuclease